MNAGHITDGAGVVFCITFQLYRLPGIQPDTRLTDAAIQPNGPYGGGLAAEFHTARAIPPSYPTIPDGSLYKGSFAFRWSDYPSVTPPVGQDIGHAPVYFLLGVLGDRLSKPPVSFAPPRLFPQPPIPRGV